MKWILFTGSRGPINAKVEEDVRSCVNQVLSENNGILTGGAIGVDYFAMDECLIRDNLSKLRVILPTKVEYFIHHHERAMLENRISKSEYLLLKNCLEDIVRKSPTSLLEMPFKKISKEEYYKRDEEEVKYADEVLAFHINDSEGTRHTVDTAISVGLKIREHKKYII